MDPMPEVICALSGSGTALLPFLQDERLDSMAVVGVGLEKDGDATVVRIREEDRAEIKGKRVILIDGAIHSGSTMELCHEHLCAAGATEVCSYSLVVKRGASFVPTFFGLIIQDADRAYFLLDEIPNNRLAAGKNRTNYVHLSVLREKDIHREPVDVGVDSMDRVTWGDRYYDSQDSKDRNTYLLKHLDNAVGYVTLQVEGNQYLAIEEVGVDRNERGKDYGAILMRFADTMARHSGCKSIRLNAKADKIPFYQKYGYNIAPKPPIKLGADEVYQPMTRPILYHVRADSE